MKGAFLAIDAYCWYIFYVSSYKNHQILLKTNVMLDIMTDAFALKLGVVIWWCQLCRHWGQQRLSYWQPLVVPLITKLVSWQHSIFSACVDAVPIVCWLHILTAQPWCQCDILLWPASSVWGSHKCNAFSHWSSSWTEWFLGSYLYIQANKWLVVWILDF